jgi:hypothetical protein
MKDCIKNSGYNIEDNEQAIAQFIIDKYAEIREKAEQFGGIEGEVAAIESFISKSGPVNSMNDITDELEPEKLMVSYIDEQASMEEELGGTPAAFILFNNSNELEFKGSTVIDNILTNYPKLYPESVEILKALKKIMDKAGDATVVLAPLSTRKDKRHFMQYDASKNKITVWPELFVNHSEEYTVKSMVHEFVHSVTARAYLNPTTYEQTQLKQLIDDNWLKYKQSEDTDYGFKNQLEFIAELYSNLSFQEKLKERESSFINKVVNAVRRILGLKRTTTINDLIDAIIQVSSQDQFAPETDITLAKETKPDFTNDRTTPNKRLNSLIKDVTYSLEDGIRKAKEMILRVEQSSPNAAQYLSGEVFGMEQIKEVVQAIKLAEELQGIEAYKGLYAYVQYMNSTLTNVRKLLDEVDYTNVGQVKELLVVHNTYITSYAVAKEMQDDLEALRNSSISRISKKEIDSLQNDISIAIGEYTQIESKLKLMKNRAVGHLLNNIKYWPEIETKHQRRLAKEYNDSNISEEKTSWIIDKMQNRDKELIENDVQEKVNQVLNSPLLDIYAQDVSMNTAINVSSPLIQIVNQLLLELETERNDRERSMDLKFKAVFEKLVKEVGSRDPQKLFKNIVGYDKNGQPFIENEYVAALNNYTIEKDEIYKKYNKELEKLHT